MNKTTNKSPSPLIRTPSPHSRSASRSNSLTKLADDYFNAFGDPDALPKSIKKISQHPSKKGGKRTTLHNQNTKHRKTLRRNKTKKYRK